MTGNLKIFKPKLKKEELFKMKYLLDNKFIFAWTPKGGCTTVTKMVFDAMGILDEALEYHPWVHEYRSKVLKPNTETGLQLKNNS